MVASLDSGRASDANGMSCDFGYSLIGNERPNRLKRLSKKGDANDAESDLLPRRGFARLGMFA